MQLKQLSETTENDYSMELARLLSNQLRLPFCEEEIASITLFLLGVYSQTLPSADPSDSDDNSFVKNIVTDMLTSVDSAMGTSLRKDKELYAGLMLHVKPMVYRLLHDIPVQNYLIEDIKTQHPFAYYAAVMACNCLERASGTSVSVAEIGFIALHIGAALERQRTQPQFPEDCIRALVVCAGGIGTGKILQSRIEAELDNIRVISVVNSLRAQDAVRLGADIIISTIALQDPLVPCAVVHPLLPPADKSRLRDWLRDLPSLHKSVVSASSLREPIMALIQSRYHVAKPDSVNKLIDAMLLQLNPFLVQQIQGGHEHEPTIGSNTGKKVYRMTDVLTTDCILANCEAHNREEVVDRVGQLLVEAGKVEPRYLDAMKASLAKNGPYMVIVPGVALLHARPEDGVKQVCMSLITLKEGVAFGHPDNDPVDVAIAFGAVDQHQHLEALADLMRIFADDESMKVLRHANEASEIAKILEQAIVKSTDHPEKEGTL